MITLLRIIRYYQLKIKWKLAIMQFIDQEAKTLLRDPKEFEKMCIHELVQIINATKKNNLDETEN